MIAAASHAPAGLGRARRVLRASLALIALLVVPIACVHPKRTILSLTCVILRAPPPPQLQQPSDSTRALINRVCATVGATIAIIIIGR